MDSILLVILVITEKHIYAILTGKTEKNGGKTEVNSVSVAVQS